MKQQNTETTTRHIRRRQNGTNNTVNEITRRASEVSKLSLYGASAMGFPDKISPVRGVMASRQASQRVVLTNPEPAMLCTGAENEYGKRSSWDIKVRGGDWQLMRTFKKFPSFDISPVAYIFKNLKTGKYHCEIVNAAEHLVEKYGFRMNDCIKNKFVDGDILPEGTNIAQSSSYVDDNYCAGVNLRFGYTVLPELTEDALIISDLAAKRLEYDMVDIVTVPFKQSAFLLNKYGNESVYKPFPDIGEKIQKGVICSIRENSYISSAAEARVPHVNDQNYYSKGANGIIVDINIATNVEVDNDQFNFYLRQIRDWYSQIYAYISTIIVDGNQDDTTLQDIYHQADKYLNSSKWVTKEEIVDTIIEFKVLQHKEIRPGQKVTGRMGNKSVIAEIRPWQEMPRTDDGRPFDMLANGLALNNRIISFAAYEGSITFQMERMWQHIKRLAEEGHSQEEIIDLSAEFVGTFTPYLGQSIRELYSENPDVVYNDIITNGFIIQIEPMNEVCVRDALIECYQKWPDIMKPYKIQTKLRHRWITLDEESPVGYQYTWVLKQEPGKALSSVATARTTLYDQPVKTRRYNKNLIPYSDNPIKYGEYDTYNYLAAMGVKELAKIATYYRGSQYQPNSVLMSQLSGIGIDTTKYNQFPQIDNLKNVLKMLGTELVNEPCRIGTIGTIDECQDVMIGNVKVSISQSDLHYMLIMYSYFLQYNAYKSGCVAMDDFYQQMLTTHEFDNLPKEYVQKLLGMFTELLPTLQQMKQYH